MKNNSTCPKCKTNDIIRIPGYSGPDGLGNNIRLGFFRFYSVKVTRYVCCNCGFSEEWIDNSNDIEKLKNKYKK
ncbi:MAG: hypothetical protein ABI723_06280 [Bacteroidia bacterium]